jgi:hypothetical protein
VPVGVLGKKGLEASDLLTELPSCHPLDSCEPEPNDTENRGLQVRVLPAL